MGTPYPRSYTIDSFLISDRERLYSADATDPAPTALSEAAVRARLVQPRGRECSRHPADPVGRHPGAGKDPGRAGGRPRTLGRDPDRRRPGGRPPRRGYSREGRGSGAGRARRRPAAVGPLPAGRDPDGGALSAAPRPARPARSLSQAEAVPARGSDPAADRRVEVGGAGRGADRPALRYVRPGLGPCRGRRAAGRPPRPPIRWPPRSGLIPTACAAMT